MENKDHWDQFYQSRIVDSAPSLFSHYVVNEYPGRRTIVEVGCGDGRDALWFGAHGLRVIGFDSSSHAIARCIDRARSPILQCHFQVLDVGHESLTKALELYDIIPKETLIYARFFLHAINDAEEQAFLGEIAPLVRAGARFCVEARSVEDEDLPKVEPSHFRRFISLPGLETRCRALGMRLERSQTGKGLAPYRHEDPVILRAVFRSERDD